MRAGVLIADRYRLDGLLGRGGMGEVWRARDTRLGREVAVKVLREHVSIDPQLAARFQREALLPAGLQHKGITVVHDFGDEHGRLYIVMELLAGRNLSALIADHPAGLPVDRSIDLAVEVADVLAYAHAKEIAHRDLKPSNIIVQGDGGLKVCDFGIAKDLDATRITLTGQVLGTPAYMAPEQWQGSSGTSADLYALGCVLFEMLTGEQAFPGPTAPACMNQHFAEERPAPGDHVEGIPPTLNDLVRSLLSKDAAGRPGSATEIIARLGASRQRPATVTTRFEPLSARQKPPGLASQRTASRLTRLAGWDRSGGLRQPDREELELLGIKRPAPLPVYTTLRIGNPVRLGGFAAAERTLYIGDARHHVLAVDVKSGELAWEAWDLPSRDGDLLLTMPGRQLLAAPSTSFASEGVIMECLNPQDGGIVWKRQLLAADAASRGARHTIYATSDQCVATWVRGARDICGWSLETGERRFAYRLADPESTSRSLTPLPDGRHFLWTTQNGLTAFDTSGQTTWASHAHWIGGGLAVMANGVWLRAGSDIIGLDTRDGTMIGKIGEYNRYHVIEIIGAHAGGILAETSSRGAGAQQDLSLISPHDLITWHRPAASRLGYNKNFHSTRDYLIGQHDPQVGRGSFYALYGIDRSGQIAWVAARSANAYDQSKVAHADGWLFWSFGDAVFKIDLGI